MKYLIISVISFFMVPCIVFALDKPYLTSLEITNGVNTISFDSKNDLYTINVYEDIDSLDIVYKTNFEDTNVEIVGNELIDEINDVYINLDYNGNTNSYHLIVNKIDDTKPVFNNINNNEDIKDNKVMQIIVIIGTIIINLIVIKKVLFNK